MEGGRPQPAASRPAAAAIPTQNNTQKMVQDTGGESVDQRMEGRQERPRDIQAHADAHKESAAAPREAQQEGERATGATANREDRAQRLPVQPTRSGHH